jgi:type VI secretion system secreted protein Hcp
MPVSIFVTVTAAKQGAFKGESTQKGHENAFDAVGFDYGVTVPHDAASGQASGKRQHHPVTITKAWGASSPQFYAAAYNNEVLTSVVIEFHTLDSKGLDVLDHRVTLSNATVESVNQSVELGAPADVDARELMQISLAFQKIDIESLTGKTSAMDDWNAPTV